MLKYVLKSPVRNPYDHEDLVKQWMATDYLIQKEKGRMKKDCLNDLIKSRSLASNNKKAAYDWANTEESGFDNTAPIWDITMDQLEEAYKTTAMDRYLDWNSDRTYEAKTCCPFFKIPKRVGDFKRRIPWLYVTEGN